MEIKDQKSREEQEVLKKCGNISGKQNISKDFTEIDTWNIRVTSKLWELVTHKISYFDAESMKIIIE